jgi:hypothetical protein
VVKYISISSISGICAFKVHPRLADKYIPKIREGISRVSRVMFNVFTALTANSKPGFEGICQLDKVYCYVVVPRHGRPS